MKDRSFAAKAKKTKGTGTSQCPVCGEHYTVIMLSKTVKSSISNAYRYSDRMVLTCKCNQKEVWG